ncbi:MAG: hypothetical protein NVS3B20_19790 [Polyangiales bacterium]
MRVSPYGESGAVVTVFTERAGITPALAKHARSTSPRKSSLVLEPFHTLTIEVASGSGELSILRSSQIEVARDALLTNSRALETAGLACRWARTLLPARVPEATAFAALSLHLDRLVASLGNVDSGSLDLTGTVVATVENPLVDASADSSAVPYEEHRFNAVLAAYGLSLLETLGYDLSFAACARCARPRPKGRAGYVSASVGGVVCESCRGEVASSEVLFSGQFLDCLAVNHEAVLRAPKAMVAPTLAVVRDALDRIARTVGARSAGR